MKCDDCKFAEWKRTTNGRLHPNKTGRCTYEKDVQIPASMQLYALGLAARDRVLEIRGGYIERGHEFSAHCPMYSREAKK